MASEKLFYIGVKGIIKNSKGEMLLLYADVSKFRKQVKPYWDIPGGRIQKSDTVLQTLEREIFEETGLEATNPTFVASVISNHEIPIEDDELAGLLLMIYEVTAETDATITISEEHLKYGWFSATEAKKLLALKYPPEFIDQL